MGLQYLALGDAPADNCLAPGCRKQARNNLYEGGLHLAGPFCDDPCLGAWMAEDGPAPIRRHITGPGGGNA
jgi:hypothetical protein